MVVNGLQVGLTKTIRPSYLVYMATAPLRGPSEIQRAKSEQTRARVLDAAVEIIAREGARGATTQRLVRASGVSWGSIQYQFGSKAGVFEALLDRTLLEFASGLEDTAAVKRRSLARRVKMVVEGVAGLLNEPTYRALRQILNDPTLLEELGLDGAELMRSIQARVGPRVLGLMKDGSHPEARLDLAQSVLFATLSGIVEQSRYEGFPKWMTAEQMRLLERHLLELISGPYKISSPRRGATT